eukprot:1980065-Rhodomonas_salina.1
MRASLCRDPREPPSYEALLPPRILTLCARSLAPPLCSAPPPPRCSDHGLMDKLGISALKLHKFMCAVENCYNDRCARGRSEEEE